MKYKIILIFILIGLLGCIIPVIFSETNLRSYQVQELKLDYPEGVVDQVSLYKPQGEGPFPGIIFGTGAGADRALYRNWAHGFINQGFVVIMRSSSYGRNDERPWIDARDDIINTLDFVKKLDYVKKDSILIGGHSASANLAYWAGYEIPEQIAGIIAIAGRFPPENLGSLDTEIFLGTGTKDKLVPPEKLHEVAGIFKGTNNKEIINKNIEIYLAENINHLQESWNNELIYEATMWAAQTLGFEYNNDYVLDKITVWRLLIKFFSIILLLIGFIMFLQEYLINNFKKKNKLVYIGISFIYFVLFSLAWSNTISKYIFYSGPFFYKWPKYLLTLFIVTIIGVIYLYIVRKDSKNIFFIDILYIISSIIIILKIFSYWVYIPPFSYGGSIIFFKGLIISLLIMIFGYILKKINLYLYQRLIIYGLSLVWLLTAVLPPK